MMVWKTMRPGLFILVWSGIFALGTWLNVSDAAQYILLFLALGSAIVLIKWEII